MGGGAVDKILIKVPLLTCQSPAVCAALDCFLLLTVPSAALYAVESTLNCGFESYLRSHIYQALARPPFSLLRQASSNCDLMRPKIQAMLDHLADFGETVGGPPSKLGDGVPK
jgi:hypothetical protein